MSSVGFTANIRVTMSDAEAKRALIKVLIDFQPDWGIVTEWDGPLLSAGIYKMRRPQGGGSPLVYNSKRYTIESTRTVVLAKAGNVGRLPGRKSYLDESKATVYKMREKDGRGVAVVGIHLDAEVQKGDGYRTDWKHAKRVARHKVERLSLTRLVADLKSEGWLVYVAGDTNFAGMTISGMYSCWEGRRGGTLGNRPVDIIFGPDRGTTLRTLKTPSDHDALRVGYPN